MGNQLDGLRILVVEDEYFLAAELQEVLRELGADVLGPFGRLQPALAAARQGGLDGAVLDVRLNGETVDELAADLLAQGVPLIVTTGYGAEQLPPHLRGLPCLRKPYDPDALRKLAVQTYRR